MDFATIQFAAILVLSGPQNWSSDLQLCLDVLISKDGIIGTQKDTNDPEQWAQHIPIHSFASDLTWKNDHPVPRLATGSFNELLKSLYRTHTGYELDM